MSYFNPMERIRKEANFPQLKGGVPPKTHRKCSDWAQYATATENVTRAMLGDILACKEAYAALSKAHSELAGKFADLQEKLAKTDKERMQRGAAIVVEKLHDRLTVDERHQLVDAIN